jgi:hypothetical protein
MDCLKENNVRIEENKLRQIYCVELGILTGSIAKDETVKLHEERLKKLFKKKAKKVLEFYLNIKLLVYIKETKCWI